MIKLCHEVTEYNDKNKAQIIINHWGNADKNLINLLLKASKGSIKVNGYCKDWLEKIKGVTVFLSNYEGFGLAAYESANYGIPTYVNEAFPIELVKSSPNIKRIKTNHSQSIIDQIDFIHTNI